MNEQSCWGIWPDRGFLIQPDPLTDLRDTAHPLTADAADHLQSLAGQLPEHIAAHRIRRLLEELPIYDVEPLRTAADGRIRERVFQIYAHLASAYVHTPDEPTAHRIPAGVAVPLVKLSDMVERPPILAYTSYTLANWQRIDPEGGITVDNLRLVQSFTTVTDAAWFILIHVDIEALAAPALLAIPQALEAAANDDTDSLAHALQQMHDSLRAMIATLERMPEGCDPDVYYNRVRPYIFGFDHVIYEGVSQYGGEPHSFRGETGAQSSVIPALVLALGLEHEQTGLTHHLQVMRHYMPAPHRRFLRQIDRERVRATVIRQDHHPLREAYNHCLQALLDFRRLHLHYAATYIAEKVENPQGTGGTVFMDWLQQLVDETEQQLVRPG